MKGMLCTTAYYGSAAKAPDFWDNWMDANTWETYNDYYTNMILEESKSYLVAVALFDELDLTLPDSYTKEIDEKLEKLVEDEADGSRTAFNAIIGAYGVNYEMLREAYIVEAKIAYLQDHLFGVNGAKVGANIVDEYYRETYARFKQVFLYTFEYVYETDVNGDHIFYKDNGKISYDTEKGAPKAAESGEGYVLDKNGDRIYFFTDDKGKERIAYKKTDATKKLIFDEKGNAVTRQYNDTELELLTAEANDIMSQITKGDTVNFDVLVSKHSEDKGLAAYPDGYYVTPSTVYEAPEVIKELFKMEVGDYKMLKSEYGIHIFMRYDIEDKAYANEKYDDTFIDMENGGYVFMDELVSKLYVEYLEPYKSKAVVDEDVLKTVDIKRAGVNLHY
jgi:hypothetical protein